MENATLAQAVTADPNLPAALSEEQAAQVAGGLTATGVVHVCCLTCGSFGRPLFSAVAQALAT